MEYITTMKMNELNLKCVNTGHLKKKNALLSGKKLGVSQNIKNDTFM